MSVVATALAIAAKDLRIEWRHRTAFATSLLFAVLVLLVFVFAHDSGSVSLAILGPSVLWCWRMSRPATSIRAPRMRSCKRW